MLKQVKLISNFSARSYQQSIFAKSINKNSLVVLPTGLGKTVVALMLSIFYFNQNNKKILFLAPTKPLVEQQMNSFKEFILNSSEFNFQVLTGLISPKKRIDLYKKNDFIFSTPQLIENDIINNIINPKDFCFVIFDEAHRATGNYAYNFIAQEFSKFNSKFLALSASPGTSKDEINSIISNLYIESLDVKSYDDFDVRPYVNKTKIENVEVEMPKEFDKIRELLSLTFNKKILQLKEFNMLIGKNMSNVSKRDLLDLQSELRKLISSGDAKEEIWKAISIAAGVMKLQYGIELFESQEISAAHTYFYNIFRDGGDKSKAAEELRLDVNFREAFDKITKLKDTNVLHPKLLKLKEIVIDEVNKNCDLRILIFNQYRDSATKIVSELNKIKEINSSVFIGQAKKGDIKMSQKDQQKILSEFREGKYNVLVSTSVGEEGLDIPKVDLVIFYEPVASAIRTIQRVGRTGRFKEGKAYILQTKGTRDIVTKHIANAKEKRMYKVLSQIQSDFEGKNKQVGLGKYIKEEKPVEDISISVDDKFDLRASIYIDQRENSSLIKELFKIEDIKVISKQLEVGDIIISDKIAIERKAKIDFVNSILDNRLFDQIRNLAKNYSRPILIVEGSENIFALRNLNPNVIRATISSIAIDYRMPIIFTDSINETSQMIAVIARRELKKGNKEISLATNKKSFSENEELEKVVSTIPRINVVIAKKLLEHFGSIKKLVNIKEKELVIVEGVGKTRAKNLVDFFEREYKKINK